MVRLKTLFSTEQITQVLTSIRELLVQKRNQFCDETYASTQEARTQLFILFTRFMIKEAGYMIEQALEECAHYLKNYQGEKDHIKNSMPDLFTKKVFCFLTIDNLDTRMFLYPHFSIL